MQSAQKQGNLDVLLVRNFESTLLAKLRYYSNRPAPPVGGTTIRWRVRRFEHGLAMKNSKSRPTTSRNVGKQLD
jgi:hypothetical protein